MKTSVALCTYNGEQYLAEQLDSILSQSVKVNEIVICDDGSSDKTKEILLQYQKKFPNIFKLYFNDETMGYVRNFEQTIEKCTGDLIFLSDQDDVWLPEKIQTITHYLAAHPEIKVFAHEIELLYEDKKRVKKSFWNNDGFNPDFSNTEIMEYILFHKNVFPGMSLVITQKAKEEYLPLQKIHPKIIHDYEIVIKACNENALMLIPKTLALYRVHGDQNIGINILNLAQSQENLQSIYYKSLQNSLVKRIVEHFQLPADLTEKYRLKCRNDYRKYLSKLSFLQKIITQLKVKYYYKISDGFS